MINFKCFAKEKLKEKNIKWEESYTEKTLFLKEQFEEVVGKGSYFRFEGKDYDSGGEYYVIVGPARIHAPRAKFFAGVRKLPATYPAGGQYFDSLDGAINYAHDTWGVPVPKDLKPYTSSSLHDIAKRVKKWKEDREDEDNNEEEDKVEKSSSSSEFKRVSGEGESIMKNFNLKDFFKKIAKGAPQRMRETYHFWNYDELKDAIDKGTPPQDWEELRQSEPSMDTLLYESNHQAQKKRLQLMQQYNLTPEMARSQSWFFIAYHPKYGGYMYHVAPHVATDPNSEFAQKYKYKYGYFNFRATPAAPRARKSLKAYSTAYGIKLDLSDLKLKVKSPEGEFDASKKYQKRTGPVFESMADPRLETMMTGIGTEIEFNSKGLGKFRDYLRENYGPLFDDVIEDLSRREFAEAESILNSIVNDPDKMEGVFEAVRRKYDQMVASGEAAALAMPPPPFGTGRQKISFKQKSGQQQFTQTPAPTLMINQLTMEKEVADIMADGVEESSEIAGIINQRRAAINEKFANTVSKMDIDIIKNSINKKRNIKDADGNVVGTRSYADIAQNIAENIEGLGQKSNGFNSLKDALEMAQLYMTHSIVDPATQAKLNLHAVVPAFEIPESAPNTSSEDLKQWHQEGEEYKNLLKTDEEKLPETSEESIERDIGDISKIVSPESKPKILPESEPVEEVEEKPADIPSVKTPTPKPEEKTEESEEETEEPMDLETLRRLMGGTLKGLIRIAAELDNDGKYGAAEEVHAVIRKYQARML